MTHLIDSFNSAVAQAPASFHARPGWSVLDGHAVIQDCVSAILLLPRDPGTQLEFTYPRIAISGACALGVFVTLPSSSGITTVSDSWDHITHWIRGLIHFNYGPIAEGWIMNMRSGVEVCFYEPAVVDPYRMCSNPRVYDINHSMSLARCLDIMYIPPSERANRQLPSSSPSSSTPEATKGIPGQPEPGRRPSE